MPELRDYQIKARDKILAWSKSDPAIANTLVSCMGSGKTFITCAAIDPLVTQQNKRIWVCVNREELVEQWQAELKVAAPNLASHGRDVGTIAGSNTMMLHRRVQIVMVQTLTRRLAKIPDKYAPDICFWDESHESAFQRVASALKQKWPHVKQINLTATPVRHGKSPVQYADLFPKDTWHVVKTAKEMVHEGLWKRPIWKSASDALAEKTLIRFSGMKETGGDYDDTDQATVMIDLLPQHLQEWKALGGDKHHCVFFCVNVEHSMQTVAALKALGRKAVAITGQSDKGERKRAIEAFKRGEVDDLVNCQCLTTGFDAPIASCAVWLRKTLSAGLFSQMAGRVLRKYNDVTEALMLDLAGNLSVHPFVEEMDWIDYAPCMKMFRDPKLVMCQACNHRHDAIPTPMHPSGDRRIGWLSGQALFKDGREISLQTVISCHSCKAPVYADIETLTAYGLWQKSCRSAKMAGQKPPQYDRASAGISIGIATDQCETPLTIELLYELGIWRLSSGEVAEVQIKDRSDEYREMLIRIAKNYSRKELCDQRFELLTPKQQRFILNCHAARLKEIENHADRYRAAIGSAYCSDRSFVWASQYWGEANGMIPKNEVIRAFKAIWQGNPSTFSLLEQWLEQHCEKHREDGQMKKYGAVRDALKLLQSLTWEDQIAA